MELCETDELYRNFEGHLRELAYRHAIPLMGTFELTARCNFNCGMCYVHLSEKEIRNSGKEEFSMHEWIELARSAQKRGLLYLTLTGGEIFTRPDFRELYEQLNEMGFLIQLMSNGYLIDERVMKWLSKRPPYSIRLTLYGMSNEIYEKVCGVYNGFDRVDRAIALLQQADIPISLAGTIVKDNNKDILKMERYAYEKRIPFKHSIALTKPRKGIVDKVDEFKVDLSKIPKEITESIPEMKNPIKHAESALGDCGMYRQGFWVTWDGRLTLCSFMEEPSLDLRKEPFDYAWLRLLNELEKVKKPDACSSCKYEGFCPRCPGRLYADCGACDKVTPQFCSLAKEYYRMAGFE